MARQSKQEKAMYDRIDAAYNKTCSGVQINMMDILKVAKVGYKLLSEGADDAKLEEGIKAFVETIRVN